jgi:hypothetical protein
MKSGRFAGVSVCCPVFMQALVLMQEQSVYNTEASRNSFSGLFFYV